MVSRASEILMAGRVSGGAGETLGALDVLRCCFAAFLVCLGGRFLAIEPFPRLRLVLCLDAWGTGTSHQSDLFPAWLPRENVVSQRTRFPSPMQSDALTSRGMVTTMTCAVSSAVH